MRWTAGVGGALLVFGLGCSGLMGYGEEMGRKTAKSGKPFTIAFTTVSPEAHSIWFEVDLEAKGDYGVTGNMAANGQKWKVDLDSSGSPVSGGSGRTTLNWVETNLGNSSARGTIFAADIDAVPVGTKIELKGTLTLSPGTKGSVDVIVTD
jgi:hypothetical protein